MDLLLNRGIGWKSLDRGGGPESSKSSWFSTRFCLSLRASRLRAGSVAAVSRRLTHSRGEKFIRAAAGRAHRDTATPSLTSDRITLGRAESGSVLIRAYGAHSSLLTSRD